MSDGLLNAQSQLKILQELKILKDENIILRKQNEELRRKNLALMGDRDSYKLELDKLKGETNNNELILK